MSKCYSLMFDMWTGEIEPYDKAKHLHVDNISLLVMSKNWTPYYTLSGVYFGHACGDDLQCSLSGGIVTSYWGLNK